MRIRVAATLDLFQPDAELEPVVIDLLRFTTCVAAALHSGALALIPCATVEQARAGRRPGDLLAGERDSLPIPGFDLGNSPLDFQPTEVRGRRIRTTTTNGTRAVQAAGTGLCVALVNRAAVVRHLASRSRGANLVCAGDQGRFAAEDWLVAGAVVAGLRESGIALEADDAARASEAWFKACRGDLEGAVARTDHGADLLRQGLGEDLQICSRLDFWNVVPGFTEGIIRDLAFSLRRADTAEPGRSLNPSGSSARSAG